MYCIHCGAALPEEAEFCSRCGKPRQAEREPLPKRENAAAEEQRAPLFRPGQKTTAPGIPAWIRTVALAVSAGILLVWVFSSVMITVLDWQLTVKPAELAKSIVSLMLLVAFLAIPPIVAARGTGYRGMWFGLAVLFMALGLLSCLAGFGAAGQPQYHKDTAQVGISAGGWLLVLALGNLMAGFFYKRKA